MNINTLATSKNTAIPFQRKKDKDINETKGNSSQLVSPERLMLLLSLAGALNAADVDARGGGSCGGSHSSFSSSRSSYSSGRSSYSSGRSSYSSGRGTSGSSRSSRLGGFNRSSSKVGGNSSRLNNNSSKSGIRNGQTNSEYYRTNRDQILRGGRTYYYNDYYSPINPVRDILLYQMLTSNKSDENDFLINDIKKTPDGLALGGYVGNDEFQMEVSKKKDGYSVQGNYLPENQLKKDTIDLQVKNNEIEGRIGKDKFTGKVEYDKDNDSYAIKVEDKDGKRISVDVDKDKKVEVSSSSKAERDVLVGCLVALGVVFAGGAVLVGKEMLD